MREELRALLRLQRIDNQTTEAEQTKEGLDDQLRDLRNGLDLLRQELQRQEHELEETRQLKHEHEAALKAQEEAIARSKARMAGVKKSHEYKAFQVEQENLRKSVSTKEEEILRIIEVEEASRKAIEERRAKLEQLAAAVVAFEQSHKGQTAEVGDQVAELEGERRELLAGLPKPLVRQYERIRKARDGVALAEVQDELCLACHMGLPPQLYNELQRGDKIVTCPSCNRILYYVEHEEEQEQVAR